jgi:mannose-6-phosphate isomerase-like protein (cupin superfamily)
MLILVALLFGFTQAQEPAQAAATATAPPPATFVGAAEIESTLRQSIANNTLDKRVALATGGRGTVRVGVVHRSTQEPRALMHEELTEIYQIIEGSGTLLTGGAMTDCAPVADPPNLGPTRSYFCTMTSGVSQKVNAKDIIIVPAGTPHKFSQLDGPISYLIYRFEVPQAK